MKSFGLELHWLPCIILSPKVLLLHLIGREENEEKAESPLIQARCSSNNRLEKICKSRRGRNSYLTPREGTMKGEVRMEGRQNWGGWRGDFWHTCRGDGGALAVLVKQFQLS